MLLLLASLILFGCSSKKISEPIPDFRLLQLDEYLNRANASYLDENYQEAIFLAEKALEVDPCNAIAYDILGLVSMQNNHTEQALVYFWQSVRCNQNYFKGYLHLAGSYYLLGDYDMARKLFLKGFDINPVDEETNKMKRFFIEANLFDEQDIFEQLRAKDF
ncbi:MAG: hypothetical protein NZT61_06245 [Deltaproteobacteria bacterium]|nr:hypothetical protein [Deltaproteobacteria bacterium]